MSSSVPIPAMARAFFRKPFLLKPLVVLLLILLTSVIGWGLSSWLCPAAAWAENSANASVNDRPASRVNFTQADIQQFEDLKRQAIAATRAGDFATAETYWTQLIEQFPTSAALWSNRGNVRAGQNHLEEALADYDEAVRLAPDEADPYLNRGATLEALGRWEEAIASYDTALQINPQDVAAYNNRGNAHAGQGQWEEAIADYLRAMELDSNFALAQINHALALYQVGETDTAIQKMRGLARKYPRFADARAALTAALWDQGFQGEAESNWVAARGLDGRYRDISWVAQTRRWPPALVDALERFLNLQAAR